MFLLVCVFLPVCVSASYVMPGLRFYSRWLLVTESIRSTSVQPLSSLLALPLLAHRRFINSPNVILTPHCLPQFMYVSIFCCLRTWPLCNWRSTPSCSDSILSARPYLWFSVLRFRKKIAIAVGRKINEASYELNSTPICGTPIRTTCIGFVDPVVTSISQHNSATASAH